MKHFSTLFRSLPLLSFLIALQPARASHICGAELYHTHQGGDTYELELHVYSDLNFLPDTQWMDAADGNIIPLVHSSAQMQESFCCAYRHVYFGEHDYPVDGVYLLHAEIFSRQASVINIMDPASTTVCVTTQLAISSVIGPNTSVRFNSPQTAAYFVGTDFVHDTQPSDADGDSLSFELISPAGDDCIPIYPYDYPHEVSPAPDTSWIDPITGVFTWSQPTYVGKYVLAIRCWEWRNGIAFSSVVRDMNLCIYATTDLEEPVPAVPFAITSGDDGRNITATIPGEHAAQLMIFDIHGRRVQEFAVAAGRNTIDLHALAPGTYVAQLQPQHGAPTTTRFALW